MNILGQFIKMMNARSASVPAEFVVLTRTVSPKLQSERLEATLALAIVSLTSPELSPVTMATRGVNDRFLKQ